MDQVLHVKYKLDEVDTYTFELFIKIEKLQALILIIYSIKSYILKYSLSIGKVPSL